jgi:ABC-type Fe3+/spermidine/putrescine transport system ATPase subunit
MLSLIRYTRSQDRKPHKKYGGTTTLGRFSIDTKPSELMVLLGPS